MRLLITIVALAPLVTTGCNSVVCGDGTFSSGRDCIGYDPNDETAPTTTATPPGGRSREELPESVQLMSDEPATIYFTTDGSDPDPATSMSETSPVTLVDITQGMTLKWFAVDRTGNREDTKTTLFDSDTVPPAPPSGLTVTLNGTTADVSWTPPTDADYAGVAIARVLDVVDVAPATGMAVSPGMLSSSVQVLQAGTATSVSDPGRSPGPVRYVAWAYDDLGNYSRPVATAGSLPLGAMAIQLTYDTNNMTLAMPTVPDNISLTGTQATLNGTTLTVSLSLTNNTAKYFHNFKAEVTNATDASFTNSDGTADTFEFKSYGPYLFGPGATVSKDLTFTVTLGTTATIDLSLVDHTTFVTSNNKRTEKVNVIDSGPTTTTFQTLTATIAGPSDRITGQCRPPVLTGQRYLDVPHTHGAIERFDLLTGMRTGFAPLGIGERVNVQWIFSTGADLIVLLKEGGKRKTGTLELVRLDESLKVRDRFDLVGKDDKGFALPALHPDGRTLAMVANGDVILVDLDTFTQIDVDPSTPAIDNILTGLRVRSRGPVFFNNGDGMLVMAKTGGKVGIVKKGAAGWTTTIYQDPNTSKGYAIAATPDGSRIWLAQNTTLREFDPTTEQFTTVTYATPNGLTVIDDKMWITRTVKYIIDQVAVGPGTATVERSITLPTTAPASGHWIAAFR